MFKVTKRRVGHFAAIAAVMVLGTIVADPAFAYIGPGSGLTLIGSVLAVIAVIFLSIVGFIWYPVRRLLRNKKARKADAEQALTEKPGQ